MRTGPPYRWYPDHFLSWIWSRFKVYLTVTFLTAQVFCGLAGFDRGGRWIVCLVTLELCLLPQLRSRFRNLAHKRSEVGGYRVSGSVRHGIAVRPAAPLTTNRQGQYRTGDAFYRRIPRSGVFGLVVACCVVAVIGPATWFTHAIWTSPDSIAVPPQYPQRVPESSNPANSKLATRPSDPVPRPPDVNLVPAPIGPAPEQPVREAQAPTATLSDNDRRRANDLAPPAISVPPPSTQDLSSAGAQDQSALENTQPPERSVPPLIRPTPPRHPAVKGPERKNDTSPLQETSRKQALNRLRNRNSPPAPLDAPNAPAPEGKLEPPPEYPVTSISAVGLLCQTVTPDKARELHLDAPRGLLVTGVTAGSPAAMAGIHSNDVVLSVNGAVLRDISRLEKIAASSPNHTVLVELFRNGTRRTVQLQIE
jgi:hypothetical protein